MLPAAPVLLQDLVLLSGIRHTGRPALIHGEQTLTHDALAQQLEAVAAGFAGLMTAPGERVAVYLPKGSDTVLAMFGAAAAGGVFVPVNPVLKAAQLRHILRDSGASLLVTSTGRLAALLPVLGECPDLRAIVLTDTGTALPASLPCPTLPFSALLDGGTPPRPRIDTDLAAIFYTSGSTGQPKGVMLSHRNLVAGAISVALYLENSPEDRILSVLPLSFDAGFSQLTTGLLSGAGIVLLEYLLARDVVHTVARHQVNAITAVPPLWSQLAELDWPAETGAQLRYFASTGGVMPRALLTRLRSLFPQARPYLMYGLTEAFRSTFLPPEKIDCKPGSIGRAIPNAEVLVLREDGSPCADDEPGELVHRGALVALGYWNAPQATAERFRPVPGTIGPGGSPELAVWSGDTVVRDNEGFLYFHGRRDEMIKTSGYRVSPTEIEDAILASGLVSEVVALGLPDEKLGQRIAVAAVIRPDAGSPDAALETWCRERLPFYMLPAEYHWYEQLPRNANGKFDRAGLRALLSQDSQQ